MTKTNPKILCEVTAKALRPQCVVVTVQPLLPGHCHLPGQQECFLLQPATLYQSPDDKENAEETDQEEVESETTIVFKCEMCDFESNRKNSLAVHMGFKHRNIEQLDGATDQEEVESETTIVFKCEMCDFETNRENNLAIHMGFNHRRKQ